MVNTSVEYRFDRSLCSLHSFGEFMKRCEKRFVRRLIVMGCPAHYVMDTDLWDFVYLAARMIGIMRPGRDVIVLPRVRELESFWSFCLKILGLNNNQVLWASGTRYMLDHSVYDDLLPTLKKLITHGSWEIWPYANSTPFQMWSRELDCKVFADNEEWVGTFNTKAILHPSVPSFRRGGIPCIRDYVDVSVPKGYFCQNTKQLLAAYNLLHTQGVKRMMLKPCDASTGEGIKTKVNKRFLQTYTFDFGAVVLEEMLDLDTDSCGNKISVSIQANGTSLLGSPTDQLLTDGTAFAGNTYPSLASAEFLRNVVLSAEKMLKWLKPKGPLGFDFVKQRGSDRAFLVDPNMRLTGAHPARLFVEHYAPGSAFVSWKVNPTVSIERLWMLLGKRGMQFVPGTSESGVFPICWLPGMWGMLIAVAPTRAEADELKKRTEIMLQ